MTTYGYLRDNGHERELAFRVRQLEQTGCDDITIERYPSDTYPEKLLSTLDRMTEGDTLLTYSIASLARDISITAQVMDTLANKNARLQTVEGGVYDINSPDEQFTINVMAACNQHWEDAS